eukprot:TRINITY_DN27779_c0_g1_i2.p1 TRINITY_DN27779_c0_g1~~TRINITY_DN27779_c0_g1_i2.p1  ORF type:complete len:420 (+),score=55.97 TRINITY_DN27779_c0_g1_i2:64-1323(+)
MCIRDRSPLYHMETHSKFPIPLEQLTDVGIRQHFLIGRELRYRYIEDLKFLSEFYDNSEIEVRSTDMTRTIQSAASQMLGLYPKSTARQSRDVLDKFGRPPMEVSNVDQILENLDGRVLPNDHQAIPIHVAQLSSEYLLPNDGLCPKLNDELDNLKDTDVYKGFDRLLRENGFYTNMSRALNIDENTMNIELVGQYHDVLIADLYAGREFPEDLSKELWLWIRFVNDFKAYYGNYGDDPHIINLWNSQMFKEINNRLKAKVESPNSPLKFLVYSAHDDTLMSILAGLGSARYTTDFSEYVNGSRDGKIVVNAIFASTIFIELYQDESDEAFSVKVIFNDKPLFIDGCPDILCPFETISEILMKRVIDDYENVCLQKIGKLSNRNRDQNIQKHQSANQLALFAHYNLCLLYTSPSPRDQA